MNYLFPITYFNAFEKNLPDDIDLERMIACEGFEKAMGVLQDTHYAEFASQDSSSSLSDIIEKEEISFRSSLSSMGFNDKIIEFLYLREDLFNLGLDLKKEIFSVDYLESDFVVGSGLSVRDLREKYSPLVETIKKTDFKDLIEFDSVIQKIYFQEVIKMSEKIKSKDLKKFFIDYNTVLSEKTDEKENKLKKIEEYFLEKNKWKIEGLASVFTFFLKRNLAKKKLKIILSAKKIKLEVEEINKLIENLPALV